MVGLAAYKLGSPLHRLFAVSFAAMAVSIGAAVDWTGSDTFYQAIGPYVVAFVRSMAERVCSVLPWVLALVHLEARKPFEQPR